MKKDKKGRDDFKEELFIDLVVVVVVLGLLVFPFIH